MCSYVLYKEFLPTPKKEEGKLSPHFSRVAIKDLIKEINKSKHVIGDHSKKEAVSPFSQRNHSLSHYFSDNNGIIFRNQPKKNRNPHYSTQKRSTSPNQFTDSNFAQILHQNIPKTKDRIEGRAQTSLKILSRHHVHGDYNFYIEKHRHTELLKHNLSLNNRGRHAHSEMRHYQQIDKDRLTRTNSKSKSNLFSPEQVRNHMISDRIGLKRNGISKASPLKDIKTAKIKVGNSQIRLAFRQEIQEIPQELKSSKVIFQKKNSLRRQFLINVRKLHQLNAQKLQAARKQMKRCSRHQIYGYEPIQKERQVLGMRFKAESKKQPRQAVVTKRHNTQTLKFKHDLDIGTIQPW